MHQSVRFASDLILRQCNLYPHFRTALTLINLGYLCTHVQLQCVPNQCWPQHQQLSTQFSSQTGASNRSASCGWVAHQNGAQISTHTHTHSTKCSRKSAHAAIAAHTTRVPYVNTCYIRAQTRPRARVAIIDVYSVRPPGCQARCASVLLLLLGGIDNSISICVNASPQRKVAESANALQTVRATPYDGVVDVT